MTLPSQLQRFVSVYYLVGARGKVGGFHVEGQKAIRVVVLLFRSAG